MNVNCAIDLNGSWVAVLYIMDIWEGSKEVVNKELHFSGRKGGKAEQNTSVGLGCGDTVTS